MRRKDSLVILNTQIIVEMQITGTCRPRKRQIEQSENIMAANTFPFKLANLALCPDLA